MTDPFKSKEQLIAELKSLQFKFDVLPEKLKEGNLESFFENNLNNSQEDFIRNTLLLEEAQSIAKIGGWELNLLTNEVYWTAQTYKIYETSPQEFNPTVDSGLSYFLPESKEIITKALELAIAKGEGYDLYLDTYTTKGRLIHVRTTCKVTLENGKPIKLTGAFQDITERVLAEKVNLENNLRFQSFIENANDLLFAMNQDGVFKYVSTQWQRIFGHAPKDVVGKCFDKFVHKDDLEVCFNSLHSVFKTGEKQNNIECRILSTKGKYIPVSVNSSLIENEILTEPLGIGIARDISGIKQAEKALIENQRLSAIGEMSASIAHDFNNSLQMMMGNVELAKSIINSDNKANPYLQNIADLIGDIADRVSALQRFGNPNLSNLDAEPIDLNAKIKDCLEQLRPLWKDKVEKEGESISINLIQNEISKVQFNRSEVKVIFHNIIKNSIEAMPNGGTLTIETKNEKNSVVISIHDTGIGMDDETKMKVFQPFFTTKGLELGRGLGMSSVYSIVKDNGGDIYVKTSQLGKGTCIELVFPISDAPEIIPSNKLQREDVSPPVTLNVLWVEDDAIIGLHAQMMVESLGHECELANNGLEALEFLESDTFDLIITDLGMPKMNGWQLAEAIQAKNGIKQKIVVVSGWMISDEEIKQYSIDYVLPKPFTLDALKAIFSNLYKA